MGNPLALNNLHHGSEHAPVLFLALLAKSVLLVNHVVLDLSHVPLKELSVAIVKAGSLRLRHNDCLRGEFLHFYQFVS